ncbi:MAG: hypothetical protein ACXAC2_19210 [Candidatus Kariarchaeaceae archaeon]
MQKALTLDDVSDLPVSSSILLIRKFISMVEKIESRDFIIKLLETQKLNVRIQIISEIEELFANREMLSDQKKAHLIEILSVAKSDDAIKVRSYARLLLKKLITIN